MLLVKIRGHSVQKLQCNFSLGVSLTLVVMLTYLCINLIGKIFAIFLSAIMIDFRVIKDSSFEFVLIALVTLILTFFLMLPLRLNIKSWYQSINGKRLSTAVAFSYFSSLKKYLSVFNFCIIRFIALFLTFFIPAIPCIILVAVLKYGFNISLISLGSAFGAMLIIMAVLFVMGLMFSIYYAMGFFYTDYIYIKEITTNPFKALVLSQKIAKLNKNSLIYTIITAIPYYLLCLLLLTIPFVVPKIRARFAVYADEIL